jgi:cell division transport system permease protein
MTVYLRDGAPNARGQALADALAVVPGVESARWVSAPEAAQRLMAALGDHRQVLAGVETGIFPASIDITVRGGARTLDRLTPVVRRLLQNPWVAEVDRGPAWVTQVDLWARSMRIASLLALALAAVGSLFIVAATVALALAARRTAIEVERLVGATEAYVRGPLLLEGATVSIVGGLVASGLLLVLFRAAQPSFAVEGPLALVLAKGPLEFLSWRELLTGLATTSIIGLGGASFAARHRDRER